MLNGTRYFSNFFTTAQRRITALSLLVLLFSGSFSIFLKYSEDEKGESFIIFKLVLEKEVEGLSKFDFEIDNIQVSKAFQGEERSSMSILGQVISEENEESISFPLEAKRIKEDQIEIRWKPRQRSAYLSFLMHSFEGYDQSSGGRAALLQNGQIVGQVYFSRIKSLNLAFNQSRSCIFSKEGSSLLIKTPLRSFQIVDLNFNRGQDSNSLLLCEKYLSYINQKNKSDYEIELKLLSSVGNENDENIQSVFLSQIKSKNISNLYTACLETDTCRVRWPFMLKSPVYMSQLLLKTFGFGKSSDFSFQVCAKQDLSSINKQLVPKNFNPQVLPSSKAASFYVFPQKGYLDMLAEYASSESVEWIFGATMNFSQQLFSLFNKDKRSPKTIILFDSTGFVNSEETMELVRQNKGGNLHFMPMLGATSQGSGVFHHKALFSSDGDYNLGSANFSNPKSSRIMDLGFVGKDKKIQSALHNFFISQALEHCENPEKFLCSLNSRFLKDSGGHHLSLDVFSNTCDYIYSNQRLKNIPPENPYFFEAKVNNVLAVLKKRLEEGKIENIIALTHKYSAKNPILNSLKKMLPTDVPLRTIAGSANTKESKGVELVKGFSLEPHMKGFLLNFKERSLFLACTANLTPNAYQNSREFCYLIGDEARLVAIGNYLVTIEAYLEQNLGEAWLPRLNGSLAIQSSFKAFNF